MNPRELVDRAVVAYVQGTPEVPEGGLAALEQLTGPDGVESPVFWEAIARIGASRRQLAEGRIPRGATVRRAWEDFDRGEDRDERDREARS